MKRTVIVKPIIEYTWVRKRAMILLVSKFRPGQPLSGKLDGVCACKKKEMHIYLILPNQKWQIEKKNTNISQEILLSYRDNCS